MRVIMTKLAKECLRNIYDYNSKFSLKNAIETDINILQYISNLEYSPYLGKSLLESADKKLRELIYKRKLNSYRIIYSLLEKQDIIYIRYIYNNKQDLKILLKIHNYFNDLFLS